MLSRAGMTLPYEGYSPSVKSISRGTDPACALVCSASASCVMARKTTKRDPAKTAELYSRIQARLAEMGVAEAAASERAGLKRDAIREIGRGSVPGADRLVAIAGVLGVSVEFLAGLPQNGNNSPRQEDILDAVSSADGDKVLMFPPSPGLMRLVKPARPGSKGRRTDLIVGHVARPSFVDDRAEAYALYVPDDAMNPALRRGQLIYLDPSRPAVPDDAVRILFTDGRTLLAYLRPSLPEHVAYETLSPPGTQTVAAGNVADVHMIVGVCFLR